MCTMYADYDVPCMYMQLSPPAHAARIGAATPAIPAPQSGVSNEISGAAPVSYASLFRFASPVDVLLVVLGLLGGLCSGAAMPLFSVLFGNALDALNTTDDIVGACI